MFNLNMPFQMPNMNQEQDQEQNGNGCSFMNMGGMPRMPFNMGQNMFPNMGGNAGQNNGFNMFPNMFQMQSQFMSQMMPKKPQIPSFLTQMLPKIDPEKIVPALMKLEASPQALQQLKEILDCLFDLYEKTM